MFSLLCFCIKFKFFKSAKNRNNYLLFQNIISLVDWIHFNLIKSIFKLSRLNLDHCCIKSFNVCKTKVKAIIFIN